MQELLTVGDIGALFNINVQTLHYYDSIGLFQPAYRDKQSGYRKYQFDQIYQLASIRYLRKMGYSLEEIRKFLVSRNPQDTIVLLKERSRALHEQWAKLMQIDNAIQRKIQFIEHKMENMDVSEMCVKWFPERRYIPIGSEENLYMEDSFYFYPTIAFYEEDLKYFGAYFDIALDGIAEEMRIRPQDTCAIPAGRYLVGYHRGPYETVEQRFAELRAAFPALPLSRRIINFNVIDQFVERDNENYITEIQIPVLDTPEST